MSSLESKLADARAKLYESLKEGIKEETLEKVVYGSYVEAWDDYGVHGDGLLHCAEGSLIDEYLIVDDDGEYIIMMEEYASPWSSNQVVYVTKNQKIIDLAFEYFQLADDLREAGYE